MRTLILTAMLALTLPLTACGGDDGADRSFNLNRARLLTDLRTLAHDDMEGREAGTPGAERAREYILTRFRQAGIEPIGDSYEYRFSYPRPNDADKLDSGINIIGRIEGTADSDRVMVISAHYDHEGMRDGQIWNGADDNASGVAAMLAAAHHFSANPPEHDVIFAALDAEEKGLQGARAFVAEPPVPADTIAFNLNLDMVAMSEDRILWAVGTYHYPFLRDIVEDVAERASINMPMGYDEPTEEPGGDWTMMTDSGAFHAAGIPFIYLGVDFHPHYHRPSDTYENMTLEFFQGATLAILDFAETADERLDEIGEAAGR
ncbi:M20/M25/M40 family metallo-hydrolase [Maricaulis sp. CAU 1757]